MKSISQCSSLEEKVDATWIMFSTLGTSSPHQSPKEVAEISEMLKTIPFFVSIYCCPTMSLHCPDGVCFPC